MKKRAAAAILGILLSVSMGLEVPAAALDGGFTSGFTSEQTGCLLTPPMQALSTTPFMYT